MQESLYGYKVILLISERRLPIELALIAGSYAEHWALAQLDFHLPKDSIVWQDSGLYRL
jgi:hypothetical protein